jgi:hypothetical protein
MACTVFARHETHDGVKLTCIPPVMKACTKKKPENQNIGGIVVSIHLHKGCIVIGSTITDK